MGDHISPLKERLGVANQIVICRTSTKKVIVPNSHAVAAISEDISVDIRADVISNKGVAHGGTAYHIDAEERVTRDYVPPANQPSDIVECCTKKIWIPPPPLPNAPEPEARTPM